MKISKLIVMLCTVSSLIIINFYVQGQKRVRPDTGKTVSDPSISKKKFGTMPKLDSAQIKANKQRIMEIQRLERQAKSGISPEKLELQRSKMQKEKEAIRIQREKLAGSKSPTLPRSKPAATADLPGKSPQTLPGLKPASPPDFPGKKPATFPTPQSGVSGTTSKTPGAPVQQKDPSKTAVDDTPAQDDRDREGRRFGRGKIARRFFGGFAPDHWRSAHEAYVSEPTQVTYYEPTVYEQPLITTAPTSEAKIDWAHVIHGTQDCFIDEAGRLVCPAGSYMVKSK